MPKLFTTVIVGFTVLLLATIAIAKEIETSPSPSASPTPSIASIEYMLPYPGILPDHPLYPVKAARDRILGFMIADPVKRIEFNLLMADKRLGMGIFLSEKGKEALAEQTIAKGEKYLFTASEQLAVLKPRQQGLEGILEKMRKALTKHEEAITQLRDKSAESFKSGYLSSLTVIAQVKAKLEGIQ